MIVLSTKYRVDSTIRLVAFLLLDGRFNDKRQPRRSNAHFLHRRSDGGYCQERDFGRGCLCSVMCRAADMGHLGPLFPFSFSVDLPSPDSGELLGGSWAGNLGLPLTASSCSVCFFAGDGVRDAAAHAARCPILLWTRRFRRVAAWDVVGGWPHCRRPGVLKSVGG